MILFILLHLICVFCYLPGLLVTIPLHLIYSVIVGSRAGREPVPNRKTHVTCPDCRELVLKDARKCKHCSASLVPQ